MKLFAKIFFFIFFPALVNAQGTNFTNIDAVASKIVNNIRSISSEQIILQTNKKIYSPNENIWFKAFEIDSLTGRLRNTSKILFADLVDENDKVIHRLVLNIETAQKVGAFLSDSSLSGFYWIRAYTKNIVDHNINNIAVKTIYILSANGKVNHRLTAGVANAATTGKTSLLTIYPEGGSLISGASSRVAVKLTDGQGNGFSDSILITDSRDEITARFLTNADGLGDFIFEPSAYRKYTVFILKDNHYDSITTLPATNPFAAQVAVTEQTDQSIKIRVLLEDSIYKKDYKTFLIALNKDSICVAAEGHGNYEFNSSVSNFPPGIANIFLYSANGELLSERNIYIRKNAVSVAVQTGNNVYAARQKVSMNISITDKDKPVLSGLTVAVNDSRVTDSLNNFSLDTLAKLSANDVDLIILTSQKQNLFYWQNLYNSKNDLTADNNNSNSLHVGGVLFNKKNEPAANKSLLLMSNNLNGFILRDTTNAKGKFSFELANFNTGTPFVMQVNGEHDTQDNYHVVLDSVLNFNFKTPPALKENLSPEQIQSLKKTESFYINSTLNGQGWLPEVTVKNKPYPKETNVFPETVITKEILHSGRLNNAAEAVLEFSKLRVIGGYLMAGGPNGFKPSPSDEPQIVMDGAVMGTSISALDFLKAIPADDLDHITILTGASASGYGLIPGTGVIEIYSASGSTYSTLSSNGLITIYPKGLDSVPEFETPDYNDKHVKNSKSDDARTSVYWNGNIITDESGKAEINFFTADTLATYIVSISGITANGDKIYKTFTLDRK